MCLASSVRHSGNRRLLISHFILFSHQCCAVFSPRYRTPSIRITLSHSLSLSLTLPRSFFHRPVHWIQSLATLLFYHSQPPLHSCTSSSRKKCFTGNEYLLGDHVYDCHHHHHHFHHPLWITISILITLLPRHWSPLSQLFTSVQCQRLLRRVI